MFDLQLPCEDALWEAENSKAWSSCFPWSPNPPLQLPFRATFRGLLCRNIELEYVSRFGRLIYAAMLHFELSKKSFPDNVNESDKATIEPLIDGDEGQMLRLAVDLAASFKL
jgi:hypothetical protein